MTITEKIIALRTEKRIKSSEIANALDLHHSNYLRIEKRDKDLSINQLESIAKVLGVTLMELLNYGDENVGTANKVDNERMKQLEILTKTYEEIFEANKAVATQNTKMIDLQKQTIELLHQNITSLQNELAKHEEYCNYVIDYNAALKLTLLRTYNSIKEKDLSEKEMLKLIDELIDVMLNRIPIFAVEYDLKMTLEEFENSNPKYKKYIGGGLFTQIYEVNDTTKNKGND